MLDNPVELVYFVEFLLISVVRATQTHKYRNLEVAEDRNSVLDFLLLALVGLTMLLPLVYLFSPLLDFADYSLPHWLGWVGAVVFACAIWILWRSHKDLGRNWTPTLAIREQHELVTHGVFRHIRHPMYAAHILWGIATMLMLHNWIAGFPFLIASVVLYLSRVTSEEQMMVEQFGNQYRDYMQRTGRIIPRREQANGH